MEASIERMTNTFLAHIEPPVMQQRIDCMEESMGDMKEIVGRVLQAFAGLNAAAGLGSPTNWILY